jgi:hypothetical protein
MHSVARQLVRVSGHRPPEHIPLRAVVAFVARSAMWGPQQGGRIVQARGSRSSTIAFKFFCSAPISIARAPDSRNA